MRERRGFEGVDNSYNFAFQLHYSISFKSHEFITCIAMSTDTITKQEDNNKKKPPHILLGITGSVAAIKGPELALSLAQSLHAKVIVVLTKGGTNFWYKAKEYNNGLKWNEYCDFTKRGYSNSEGMHVHNDGCKEKRVFTMLEEDDKHDDEFKGDIAICRKYLIGNFKV